MLRKRTSFKPNLVKAGPKAPTTPSIATTNSTATATPAPAAPTIPTTTVDQSPAPTPAAPPPPSPPPSVETTEPIATPPAAITTPAPPTGPTTETGLQDVIRLTSLRNSAYKNVKLKDLLFFNPPPTKDQKRHKKNARKRLLEEQSNESVVETELQEDDSGEPSLVPKVKLGPSGQLILDESSTLIDRKNPIKSQEAIVEDNEETISRTSYDSYRRKPTLTSQAKWSLEDTQKFYHALTILGTDFSMMESLMFSGHRSRTELHKKFKREERINKTKIDVALSSRISLTSEELDDLKDIL